METIALNGGFSVQDQGMVRAVLKPVPASTDPRVMDAIPMYSKPGRKPPDKKKAIRLMAEARDAADRKGDRRDRRANACPRCNRVVVFVLDLEGKDTLVLRVDRDEDGVPTNPARRTQTRDNDKWILCERCFTAEIMDIEEAKKAFQALGPGDFSEAISEVLRSRDVRVNCVHGCEGETSPAWLALFTVGQGEDMYICECADCLAKTVRSAAMGLPGAMPIYTSESQSTDRATLDRLKERTLRLMAEAREAAGRKGDVRERVAMSCPRCDRSVVFVLEKGEGKKFVLHVDRDEDGVPANPARRTQDDDKYLCEKCFTDSRCAGVH